MFSANRLATIKPSVIREMTRLAYEHKAVNMAQGFPEFKPPPDVVEAANRAISHGNNQYSITWGTPNLRHALAEKYQRQYGLSYDPMTDLTVTCGVTEAVIATLFGLIDPGDKVIVLEPAHENYAPGISWAGGIPIWIPLAPPEFQIDETQLRAAFAQNPKAIILNSPQNPSGRVLTRDELQLIVDLCLQYNVLAITDEIYEHIIYDGREHLPLAGFDGMAERTVTISGLSKTYAATGWRIGWIAATGEVGNAIRTVHDFLTICAPTPLQEAAAVAVALSDNFYSELSERYHACRATMMDLLEAGGFKATAPEGSYYVLADFSEIQPTLDDIEFTRWLIINKQVAVVPASSFYHDPNLGRNLVRFAFPKTAETFAKVRAKFAG